MLALNEIVESTGALVGYQLRVDGISLVLDLDRNLPPVLGDAHELQQALVNLVTNAHQTIRSAGRGGTIVVRTAAPTGTDRVTLEVTDDGPGVPQEIRSRIFDPFFTTKPAGVGTGLGLSLVYAAIAAHGGEVELFETPGGGASFRLDLPIASVRSAAAPRAYPASDRDDAPRVSARILVVDDETAVAALICEALAADGHDAEELVVVRRRARRVGVAVGRAGRGCRRRCRTGCRRA